MSNQNLQVELRRGETSHEALARTVTSPECLSASVLTICQNFDRSQITELVNELKQQAVAVHADDLSRAESMLIAQAHTLDGIFAKLASQALTASQMDKMERYMRLALKSQNQARATLQTLAELKAPKQVAFVRQANIGNQVQVNNGPHDRPARMRKTRSAPNKLMEAEHEKWLDTGAASTTSRADSHMEAMGEQQRPADRRG